MNLINKLLQKNVSGVQLTGFVISNFIGLAIVIAGLQFYLDMRSLWDSEDSFLKRDYLVVNKRVNASATLGAKDLSFSDDEVSDLERQPWVRSVGRFSSPAYRVSALMEQGGRGLSTDMFFESVPSEYIDLDVTRWGFSPGDTEVPVIISRDYLALYNFGFASSAGLPQVSEQMMSSVPLTFNLRGNDGTSRITING
ncbi:MAG: ABC transporter permease, partial [Muribaculaceae bacterium]|nr:ABC transporter permease [Muribaculaceae bacterium]